MGYFRHFPKITAFGKTITDLSVRLEFTKALQRSTIFYDYMDVMDGETPEVLSHLLYGDPEYHWILLLVNDIESPHEDWPLSDMELGVYIDNKYVDPDAVIYYLSNASYFLGAGITVDPNEVSGGQRTAVTGRTHEIAENDKKRRIKVVKPAFIQPLQTLLEGVLRNVSNT